MDNGYDVPILKQATMERKRQVMRFLTVDKQERMEAGVTVENRAFIHMFILALRSGLTIREICALSWQDIALKQRIIRT